MKIIFKIMMLYNNKGRLKRKNKGRVHHVLFIFSLIKGRLKDKFQTAFTFKSVNQSAS